ncbi:hypothetical protein RND71_037701 [Anisodus tanguticus]|uniref:DM2 domain-containing protein n=1 Tax=Anisodus tanguticus TaxID=243964 RepID=A0AAE1QYA3_9SOLA|nr:hypothetical protein RND71_037701 [Anisodus tanguticus]
MSFLVSRCTSNCRMNPSSVVLKHNGQSVKRRRGGPGGLNKLCGVTHELQIIVGQATLPRTEIVKQLWAYIRKHNLQDLNNKRKIICNDELRLVFETDCTDMFKMNRLLAKHIIALEPSSMIPSSIQTAHNHPKRVKTEEESGSKSEEAVPVMIISEALANFLGTSEREMSQAEVLRQVWEYIKVNQLEVAPGGDGTWSFLQRPHHCKSRDMHTWSVSACVQRINATRLTPPQAPSLKLGGDRTHTQHARALLAPALPHVCARRTISLGGNRTCDPKAANLTPCQQADPFG